jgi:hypothetical protein
MSVVYVYPKCPAGNSEGHWLSALHRFLEDKEGGGGLYGTVRVSWGAAGRALRGGGG